MTAFALNFVLGLYKVYLDNIYSSRAHGWVLSFQPPVIFEVGTPRESYPSY